MSRFLWFTVYIKLSIGYTSAASTNTKQARPSATLRNSHCQFVVIHLRAGTAIRTVL